MKTKIEAVKDVEVYNASIKELWDDVVTEFWNDIEALVKDKELKDTKEAICEHIVLEYLQGAVDKMRSNEDDELFRLRQEYAPDEE